MREKKAEQGRGDRIQGRRVTGSGRLHKGEGKKGGPVRHGT